MRNVRYWRHDPSPIPFHGPKIVELESTYHTGRDGIQEQDQQIIRWGSQQSAGRSERSAGTNSSHDSVQLTTDTVPSANGVSSGCIDDDISGTSRTASILLPKPKRPKRSVSAGNISNPSGLTGGGQQQSSSIHSSIRIMFPPVSEYPSTSLPPNTLAAVSTSPPPNTSAAVSTSPSTAVSTSPSTAVSTSPSAAVSISPSAGVSTSPLAAVSIDDHALTPSSSAPNPVLPTGATTASFSKAVPAVEAPVTGWLKLSVVIPQNIKTVKVKVPHFNSVVHFKDVLNAVNKLPIHVAGGIAETVCIIGEDGVEDWTFEGEINLHEYPANLFAVYLKAGDPFKPVEIPPVSGSKSTVSKRVPAQDSAPTLIQPSDSASPSASTVIKTEISRASNTVGLCLRQVELFAAKYSETKATSKSNTKGTSKNAVARAIIQENAVECSTWPATGDMYLYKAAIFETSARLSQISALRHVSLKDASRASEPFDIKKITVELTGLLDKVNVGHNIDINVKGGNTKLWAMWALITALITAYNAQMQKGEDLIATFWPPSSTVVFSEGAWDESTIRPVDVTFYVNSLTRSCKPNQDYESS
ncbi:hypothetical protein BDR26DRAFT_935844 [Obelidium mucronatum]|nr:hypothetical protein BDR26DRAFT_935844 [Obelidium mucronatum]